MKKTKSNAYLLLLSLITTNFINKKEKFDAYLLLLSLLIIFLKRKAKTVQIYRVTCTMDFISKKVEYDI